VGNKSASLVVCYDSIQPIVSFKLGSCFTVHMLIWLRRCVPLCTVTSRILQVLNVCKEFKYHNEEIINSKSVALQL
jgi:hypothetical protein